MAYVAGASAPRRRAGGFHRRVDLRSAPVYRISGSKQPAESERDDAHQVEESSTRPQARSIPGGSSFEVIPGHLIPSWQPECGRFAFGRAGAVSSCKLPSEERGSTEQWDGVGPAAFKSRSGIPVRRGVASGSREPSIAKASRWLGTSLRLPEIERALAPDSTPVCRTLPCGRTPRASGARSPGDGRAHGGAFVRRS